MIIPYNKQHRQTVKQMMIEFYNSPAVLHNVPSQYFDNTLDALECNSPYVQLFILADDNGDDAGYGQLSLTYSNEVGGKVVLVEEIYIKPQYRGKRLGSQFLEYIEQIHTDAKRFRLEVEKANNGAVSLYSRLGYAELNYLQMTKER